MSAADDEVIRKITPLIKLKTIQLFSSRFVRPHENVTETASAIQQHSLGVDIGTGEIVEADGTISKAFQARVALGTRVVENKTEEPPSVFYIIEAVFSAEYQLLGEVSTEELTVFSQFNSVHNVWPFWRQHVFDIVQRGGLPQLEIPLMSGRKL